MDINKQLNETTNNCGWAMPAHIYIPAIFAHGRALIPWELSAHPRHGEARQGRRRTRAGLSAITKARPCGVMSTAGTAELPPCPTVWSVGGCSVCVRVTHTRWVSLSCPCPGHVRVRVLGVSLYLSLPCPCPCPCPRPPPRDPDHFPRHKNFSADEPTR